MLKARGVGLASGLSSVEVALDAGHALAVIAPDGPWSVRAWAPEPGFRAAVAVWSDAALPIRTFRAVPLGTSQPAPKLGPSEP